MAAIRIAVADYGAGNMVSIAALETVGASVTVATDLDGLAGADALVASASGRPPWRCPARRRGWSSRSANGSPPAGVPGIRLGLQLLYDGSDEDGAAALGVRVGRSARCADAPPYRLEPGRAPERAPDPRPRTGRRRPVLRPLVRRRPG
jgi:imidazoleglycerol phosphate synthase glutamine amidotransferase subunit HisH